MPPRRQPEFVAAPHQRATIVELGRSLSAEEIIMSDYQEPDGTGARHQTARTLAEQAIQAQADGDDDRADELFAQADRIDPEAVANALADANANPDDTTSGPDALPQDDEEIAAMSRTIQPGSDAPSRAGIGGRGSGADNEST